MKYLNEVGGKSEGCLITNPTPQATQTSIPRGLICRVALSSNSIRRFIQCEIFLKSDALISITTIFL